MTKRERQVLKSCFELSQTNLSELKPSFDVIRHELERVKHVLKSKWVLASEPAADGLRSLILITDELDRRFVELQTAAQLLHGGK